MNERFAPPSPRIPRLYTVDEAAAFARRTPKAMRQVRQRDIERERRGEPIEGPRFRKIAGRVLVNEEELIRWLSGNSHLGGDE